MPAAAATWVVTAFAAAGATSTAALTAAFWGAYIGATLAIQVGLSAVSRALTGQPKGAGGNMFDRDIVVKTTTAPREFVYGEVTKGGVLAFIGTTGNENRMLDYVIVVAGHEIESITDVWFDDVLITNAEINSGNVAGGAVGGSGKYQTRDGNPVAWIYKKLGGDGQTASTVLDADYTDWTTNHRLRGMAYVHIRLQRNSHVYEGGPPSGFRFKVKGAKCYDPRLDSTNGGSGLHRLNDTDTWEWTRNPAICTADYVIGGTITNRNGAPDNRRGFGAAPAKVVWSSVIAAANECDEDVAIPPSGTQNRYECDTVVAPAEGFPDAECIERLLTSMLGNVVYTNGKYSVYAGTYRSPVYTLTENDLAGAVGYSTSASVANRYNYVRGTRIDLDSGHEVEIVPRTDSSYQTADQGILYHDVQFPATGDEYRAQRIAQIILRRSREQKTLLFRGQLSCQKIAVWETVGVTIAELGLSNKTFRCVRKRFAPASEWSEGEPIVELTLREEFSTSYTAPLVADYGSISVATDPGQIDDELDAPTALAFTPLRNAIELSWTPGLDPPPRGVIFELFEHTSATPFASSTKIWAGTATSAVIRRDDNLVRYYWVRAARTGLASTSNPASSGMAGAAIADFQPWIPDAEFTAGDLLDWSKSANVTYQAGGLIDGMARLSPNGSTTITLESRSRYGVAAKKGMRILVGDWTAKISVRWKVQTALTGSNKRLKVETRSVTSDSGVTASTVEASAYIDLSAAVTGTWYSNMLSLAYTRDGTENTTPPRFAVRCTLDTADVTGGVLDIDYCSAEIIG